SNEPRHNVQFSRRFALGRTEVTQEQYAAITGEYPSWERGPLHPVEHVSWLDAIRFANAASVANGLVPCYQVRNLPVTQPFGVNCAGYRLPSESEWEVAARADQSFRYAGSNDLESVAWFKDNSIGVSHNVAGLAPNDWGLFDMSGNVMEWTWDAPGFYSEEDLIDSMGAERVEMGHAILRGGSWYSYPNETRVAHRFFVEITENRPEIGFRLARTLFDAP
ncbi:MAG: formylglycine-generating enzyme family protein, partial [Myxococcota bacterium]|nr:formylglycine-generating enzyme family protein [Myxococcota bacterium]